MSDGRDPADLRGQLVEHLRLFTELGVSGVSPVSPVGKAAGARTSAGPTTRVEPAERTPEGDVSDGARAVAPGDDAAPVRDHEEDVAQGAGAGTAPGPSLESIRADLGECTRCKLHGLGRRQIVFGVGDPGAQLMFVGEAPGRDEDAQGIPFVGRAGQLLTKIVESIGLTREQVYIANVIKCRPPQNRNPEPDEVETCEPFLFSQIDAIHPRVIVALGAFAARTLLRSDTAISRLRGSVYDYRGAQLVATFHPAYLLRNPERKRDVWEDMKRVRALLQERDADD